MNEQLIAELEELVVKLHCDENSIEYRNLSALRTADEQAAKDAKTIAELQGALSAQDRMQNEQLDKHRDTEILALPSCIVASPDIVDDLLDHFYGLLCDKQNAIAELQAKLEAAKSLVTRVADDMDSIASNELSSNVFTIGAYQHAAKRLRALAALEKK